MIRSLIKLSELKAELKSLKEQNDKLYDKITDFTSSTVKRLEEKLSKLDDKTT